jgi:hypothetical protein
MKPKTVIELSKSTASQAQSPEHKRFRTLLERIAKARERLARWDEQTPVFAQMHAERVQPQIESLRKLRRAWALQLEQLMLAGRWSAADAKALRRAIVEIVEPLVHTDDPALADDNGEDAEMKALYNRVSDTDYDAEDEEAADALQSMKEVVEEMTGLDLGDDTPDSPEELLARARAKMDHEREAFQARHAAAQGNKKRSAAAQRAAKKAEEDAARVSQTVREVYRKLAAALHPDRAGADATDAERQQRTEQMARVNAAYAKSDLLTLLNLQLEIEQVDVAHAAQVAASQVKHFNKVLAEQLDELEREIAGREELFEMSYAIFTERRLDPDKLGPVLSELVEDLKVAHLRIESARRSMTRDTASAKSWVKQLRREQREEDDFGFF